MWNEALVDFGKSLSFFLGASFSGLLFLSSRFWAAVSNSQWQVAVCSVSFPASKTIPQFRLLAMASIWVG